MKSTKSLHSVRSMQSSKSLRSDRGVRKADEPKSFEYMLNVACLRFQCPFTVDVNKEINHESFYKALMSHNVKERSKRMTFTSQGVENPLNPTQRSHISFSNISTRSDSSSIQNNSIHFTVLYDKFNSLTEIVFTKLKEVPRMLLKIIRVLAPFYQNLTKITISKSKIDMYTIYELSKILKECMINSICLDGSPIPMGDFTMLLNTTKLTHLSLCRCNINDQKCDLIASMLHDAAPACNLLLLNLSSNRITDVGAKHIADALRTNRHLRYLNLADNHIQDVGAGYIFDVFMEFPLTCNEITGMKRRRMKYFKLRNDLNDKYLTECRNTQFDEISRVSRSSPSRKKKSIIIIDDEYLKTKAKMMTDNILGIFGDPFDPDIIKYEDKYYYCLGNLSLQYLNLSYNNLSYISIKKLCNVLIYQNSRILGNRGLIKVVVVGNNLPITCVEMDTIKDILSNKFIRNSGRISKQSEKSLKNKGLNDIKNSTISIF